MRIFNYQGWAKELFGGACYAACLSYLFGRRYNPLDITRAILNGVEDLYIEHDGFVSKPLEFIRTLNGKQYKDVKKVAITSLAELPAGEYIVEYKKIPTAKESHFVIANKDGVIWDPSGNSITVQTGAPVSYREFVN